ncbi:unnamed protein product [Urochloa humidicola]
MELKDVVNMNSCLDVNTRELNQSIFNFSPPLLGCLVHLLCVPPPPPVHAAKKEGCAACRLGGRRVRRLPTGRKKGAPPAGWEEERTTASVKEGEGYHHGRPESRPWSFSPLEAARVIDGGEGRGGSPLEGKARGYAGVPANPGPCSLPRQRISGRALFLVGESQGSGGSWVDSGGERHEADG